MKLLTWGLLLPGKTRSGREEDKATATAYLLDWGENEEKKIRPAVVICPGGGYGHIAHREGEPVAMKYLAMGKWWLSLFPGLLLVLVVMLFYQLVKNLHILFG